MNDGIPQLNKLVQPIPDNMIEQKPRGGKDRDYVAHHVINQYLLYIVGPFSFELRQIHRGNIYERTRDKGFIEDPAKLLLTNAVVGATFCLRAHVDNVDVMIEATGDVDEPLNWPHDGARLKDAESDALKRCAMRLGLGLHLWAEEHYFLHKWLPVVPRTESNVNVTAPIDTADVGRSRSRAKLDKDRMRQEQDEATRTRNGIDSAVSTTGGGISGEGDVPPGADPAPEPEREANVENPPVPESAITMKEFCLSRGIPLNKGWVHLFRGGEHSQEWQDIKTVKDFEKLTGDRLREAQKLLDEEFGAPAND